MGLEVNVKIRFEGWQLKIEEGNSEFFGGKKMAGTEMIHDTLGILINLYTDVRGSAQY
jgi:hypothetical protein